MTVKVLWLLKGNVSQQRKIAPFQQQQQRQLHVISLSPSEFSNTTCLSCDAAFVNRTFDYTNRSVIERSIGFHYQSFGNLTFDWQNFIVSSTMFDWVRQSNDWYSITFDCRTVRLDRSGIQNIRSAGLSALAGILMRWHGTCWEAASKQLLAY